MTMPELIPLLGFDGVRDPDLVAMIEKAQGTFTYKATLGFAQAAQKKRDAEREAERQRLAEKGEAQRNRKKLPRNARRRDQIREVIENEPASPENIQHIHSVLALCGLPYREPKAATNFFREYGRNTLAINAGRLTNPITGEMEMQGLPYGPKARLLLLHLCTEAVKQRTPKIEVASSLSGFIRDMGFPVTGGERGTLKQFKEQLNRLAACSMQIGLWDGTRASTLNVPPFRQMDVWLPLSVTETKACFGHRRSPSTEISSTTCSNMHSQWIFGPQERSRARRASSTFCSGLVTACAVGAAAPAVMGQSLQAVRQRKRLNPLFPAGISKRRGSPDGGVSRLRLTLDDGGMQLLPSNPKDLLVPSKAVLANKRARTKG